MGSPSAIQQPGVEPLLILKGIDKAFGSLQALHEVSVDIFAGEIHCLLGENGAGKSTLCNMVFGTHRPDRGEMLFRGRPYRPGGPAAALAQGVAMVHQHFSLVPDLPVVDNLLLGQAKGVLNRGAAAKHILDVSERFGLAINPRALVKDLSVGERQRVEIIKCLIREPALLVLDEPTAVLLPAEIDELLAVCERIAAGGSGVVLVTHKLSEISRAADRVTVLRSGKVVSRSVTPSADMQALVRAMIQRDLTGLDAAASSMLGSASSVDPTALDASTVNGQDGVQRATKYSDEVLQVDGITVRDTENVVRVDNVSIVVNRGEIVGVAGVEGNGQTELADVLAGMRSPIAGRFYVCGHEMTRSSPAELTKIGVGVVPEDRHEMGCVAGMNLTENLLLNRLSEFRRFGLLDRQAMEQVAQDLIARFDIRAESPTVQFSSLSGGNQQKAVLGRELSIDGLALLLAAQPTRGLDVGAVESVYQHIRSASGSGVGVLLISSELDELLSIAHRIVVLFKGQVVGQCPADFSHRERIGAMMAGQAE